MSHVMRSNQAFAIGIARRVAWRTGASVEFLHSALILSLGYSVARYDFLSNPGRISDRWLDALHNARPYLVLLLAAVALAPIVGICMSVMERRDAYLVRGYAMLGCAVTLAIAAVVFGTVTPQSPVSLFTFFLGIHAATVARAMLQIRGL